MKILMQYPAVRSAIDVKHGRRTCCKWTWMKRHTVFTFLQILCKLSTTADWEEKVKTEGNIGLNVRHILTIWILFPTVLTLSLSGIYYTVLRSLQQNSHVVYDGHVLCICRWRRRTALELFEYASYRSIFTTITNSTWFILQADIHFSVSVACYRNVSNFSSELHFAHILGFDAVTTSQTNY